MTTRIKVGDEGWLLEDVMPLCCENVLRAGTFLRVLERPTPNRALVAH